jgi:hypothetical protein
MFIIDSNAYIVPRSIYGLNALPVYVYKNASHGLRIGFINIANTNKEYFFMCSLIKHDMEENEVVTFF